jgi:glycine/D-amino acid oxidase-like deaminating enzyme
MRLRTFGSFWLLRDGLLHSYPSLHGQNETCEIVVVGGGISGALISHALMEENYKVILVDKRDIAGGSTAASTSMLQYEIDEPLYKLADKIGEDAAVECYKAGITAIYDLGELIRKLDLDCNFEMKRSLYIAREKKHTEWLKKEYAIRHKHGIDVKWLEPGEIKQDYGINCFGGILSKVGGGIDAYKCAHELIAYNVKRGMKVYDQTEIEKVDHGDKGVTLYTETGCKIKCDKIIFCTGYEATKMLKERVAFVFYTYACISEKGIVIPEKLKDTLVWDTDLRYTYMRYTDDGRLLIGGEDALGFFSFFQDWIRKRKAKKLQKHLKNIMPEVDFIMDYSWGGKFGATGDGLPYIGQSPEYENTLFVLAYGGNGIVFSVQAMKIITDLLKGKENSLSRHYRFNR